MKFKERVYLANLSLKSRKKSTWLTIVGLSLGLVLLFPLLYLAIGFYGGMTVYSNRNPEERSFNVDYASTNTENQKVYMLNKAYQKELKERNNTLLTIDYENYMLDNIYYSLDDKDYSLFDSKDFSGLSFQVLNKESSLHPFLKQEEKKYTDVLIGDSFSLENSQKEIMLSSAFVRNIQLSSSDVIGHTISFKAFPTYGGNISNSDDKPEDYTYLHSVEDGIMDGIEMVHAFKVVGIYNSRIYGKNTLRSRACYSSNELSLFWISEDSLKDANNNTYSPIKVNKGNKYWYYYSDTNYNLSTKAKDNGYAYLPYGFGIIDKYGYSGSKFNGFYEGSSLLEYSGYGSAVKDYEFLTTAYNNSSNYSDKTEIIIETNFSPSRFNGYYQFYKTFAVISLILFAFGLSIFIAVTLNIFNSLQINIEELKGTLGMYRAIGMNQKDVKRLFSYQLGLLFGYSYIFITVLGGGACVAIKILFDNVFMAELLSSTSIGFTLEWYYIPIVYILLTLICSIVVFLMNKILIGKVAKQPVLELLREENK